MTWSRSTRSTSARPTPAIPSSSSRRGTWSAAGTPWSCAGTRPPPPRSRSSTLSPSGCPSRSGPSASTADRSSWPTSRRTCAGRRITLFVLSPRSPKLHGAVERANRTHTEEFYEVTDAEPDLASLQEALRDWENTCNTVRPHQALGYLTPAEFLASLETDV
ncbi:MAG: integrase core domain-containing protein [Candidatus Limnocylindrales bacterium]